MSTSPPIPDTTSDPPPRRSRRHWRAKFRVAFRGLKLGIRGHSSFAVHFFFTALVIAAAVILQCELWQWCLLLLCIAMVLIAELFNSAVETLFGGLEQAIKDKVWPALDIAAGAVLLASIVAGIVGGLIFLAQLRKMWQ